MRGMSSGTVGAHACYCDDVKHCHFHGVERAGKSVIFANDHIVILRPPHMKNIQLVIGKKCSKITAIDLLREPVRNVTGVFFCCERVGRCTPA